jgi:hypothetical protein
VVFRQPDGVEAQFLGVLNLLYCLVQDATLVRGFRLRPGGEDEQAKFHTMMPSFDNGVVHFPVATRHILEMDV